MPIRAIGEFSSSKSSHLSKPRKVEELLAPKRALRLAFSFMSKILSVLLDDYMENWWGINFI
tara:strand:+ start:145 stop:330 length:186 start_codon:yes stop_codon:yes gene_type:complete